MSLVGKRIVVTRPEEQAAELVGRLKDAGAIPIACPTIRIAPPESWRELDAALSRIESYEWVVFTSANGVRSVLSRARGLGRAADDVLDRRVAAVGASTARVLGGYGIEPAFIPGVERSRVLAEALPAVRGARILLMRSDIADPQLASALRERDARQVDDVIAYRTLLLPPRGHALEELRGGVDGVTFTSPSTVRGFLELGEEARSLLEGVAVVTLGPAATDALRLKGLEIAAEASERDMSGLVDALRLAFESAADEEIGT